MFCGIAAVRDQAIPNQSATRLSVSADRNFLHPRVQTKPSSIEIAELRAIVLNQMVTLSSNRHRG